jgi:hypothetical protein
MINWHKPPEHPHLGPHEAPPPPHGHFWQGKPPHEHLYEACEAILGNVQELSNRLAAIEGHFGRSDS